MGGLRVALFFFGLQSITQFARANSKEGALKISYSKYTAFQANMERFRLHYELGLTPENDETPSLMNFGRRRGSCFHELSEGKPRKDVLTKYGKEVLARAEAMIEVIPDFGPRDWIEREFETPIGDGKHSINGRIDHRFLADNAYAIGDFKTTKGTRTKADLIQYFGTLQTSAQSHFYLAAARAFGEPSELFTYHIVLDRKDKDHKPTYVRLDLPAIGNAELDRTLAEVYAACETIEFLEQTYGTDKPWPHSNNWPCCGDRGFCGFSDICGRCIPKGAVPPGFTTRYKELIQIEETNEASN